MSTNANPPSRVAAAFRWSSARIRVDSAIPCFLRNAASAFFLVCLMATLSFPAQKGVRAGYVPVALGIGAAGVLIRSRRWVNGWLDRVDQPTFLVGCVVVAGLLRAGAILISPVQPVSDHLAFHMSALSMLRGQGYGHTAFYPPGMSILLAGWYWLGVPNALWGKVLNLTVSLVLVLAVWSLVRDTIGRRAAHWAGILTAVMPTLVVYTATLGYELVLMLVVVAIWKLAASTWGCANPLRHLVGLGILAGFGALVKPTMLAVPALLFLTWLAWGQVRRACAFAGLIAVLMLLVVAPWTVRNARVLGTPVLVSTNGGVVLYAANNPQATGLFLVPQALAGETDEVTRDRVRGRAAIVWILEHPIQWLRLAATKTVYVWGTSSSIMAFVSFDRMAPLLEKVLKGVINVGWSALLVLCLVGSRQREIWMIRALWPVWLTLGYVFVLQLFFEALSRHHIPVLGALLLLAATTLARQEPSTSEGMPAPERQAPAARLGR